MALRRMARRRRRRVARRRIALVGGMVAFGAHKMTESQAKQIEKHTGVPPEELRTKTSKPRCRNSRSLRSNSPTKTARRRWRVAGSRTPHI